MSNRTADQASDLAALRVSHEAQIEALTAPGLSDRERVDRFAEAAGFSPLGHCLARTNLSHESPATACWQIGRARRSLFGNLPGCGCPVVEQVKGCASWPGIPLRIPADWHPTRETLEAFARVQQEARFPTR